MRLRNNHTLSLPPPKLNLGSGHITPEGYHNIDFMPGPNVQTVMDIEHQKLPFADGSVNGVLASHIFEHVAHLEFLMAEIHRVLKVGGLLEVYVPYGHNKALQHIRFFWKSSPRDVGIVEIRPMSEFPPWKLVLNEISERSLPFQWHMKRYLRREWNIGLPRELHFVLEKITREEFESRFVF
ncbi:MAG: class I SAM-dependent methyltransferase [Thermoplasmata archaeon]